MVAIARATGSVDRTTAQQALLELAAAVRLGEPELGAALEAAGFVQAHPGTHSELVRSAITGLAALANDLRRGGSDQMYEPAYAIALVAASLSPALRSACAGELRELAGALPSDALNALLDSPSPHARIGARLLTGWRQPGGVTEGDITRSEPPGSAGDPSPHMGVQLVDDLVFGESPPPMAPSKETAHPERAASLSDLEHPSAEMRLAAIGRCRDLTLTPAVAERLVDIAIRDPDRDVRIAAMSVFSSQEQRWRLFFAESALAVGDSETQSHAVGQLEPASAPEAALLIRFVVEGLESPAAEAVARLSRLPPIESVALLWAVLPRSASASQEEISRRLRDIDGGAYRFIANVAMRDAESERRIAGLAALGDMPDEPVTPLVESLSDPSVDVRLTALRSLARRFDADAIEAVGRRLRDPRPDIRQLAARILRDAKEPRAAPWLIAASADPDSSVRREVREAIRSMASAEVIDQVLRALGDEETKDVARSLLIEMGAEAIEPMLAVLHRAPPRVESAIGEALRTVDAGALIERFLRDTDPKRRRHAALGVAAMGGHDAARRLLTLLYDPEPDIRCCAIELLDRLGDPSTREALAVARSSEPDTRVCAAIDAALRHVPEGSAQ